MLMTTTRRPAYGDAASVEWRAALTGMSGRRGWGYPGVFVSAAGLTARLPPSQAPGHTAGRLLRRQESTSLWRDARTSAGGQRVVVGWLLVGSAQIPQPLLSAPGRRPTGRA